MATGSRPQSQNDEDGLDVAWWPHSPDLGVASVRLRTGRILQALRERGVVTDWFDPAQPRPCGTLVLGKRYDTETHAIATALRARGVRIVLDLCDNHFFNPLQQPALQQRSDDLRRMIAAADHVVCATATLAETVRAECPAAGAISVIGDPVDDLGDIPMEPYKRVLARWRCWRGLQEIRRLRDAGHASLVWYGNNGYANSEGGMLDLLKLREVLERLHARRPIHLTVISNSRQKFDESLTGLRLPTLYFKWEPNTFGALLRAHDIALIPVSDNAFTRCKTDNRIVTAFMHGLAVVADDVIPSYAPYAHVMRLGDWDGIESYLADPARRARDVAAGRELALQRAAIGPIVDRWLGVLPRTLPAPGARAVLAPGAMAK